ncbi:TetR/AcrR family transcriptional regulator [Streptococcus sp.]|nr:TetR/AcrR family transcriptional regulator [Streptococcus sp.]MDY3824793.1 TetR/AcrR family transcriptional regulator [Streptococcus sp.]
MDRRVKKTKEAIYTSFTSLLNQKSYDELTVQEIINLADVGRSTFYAHFDSKEMLLEHLCRDLFHHTFEQKENDLEGLISHILSHFYRNQDKVASLLLSRNLYFMNRLKHELDKHLFPLFLEKIQGERANLPKELLKHQISSAFIESTIWWLKQRQTISPEELSQYLLAWICPQN